MPPQSGQFSGATTLTTAGLDPGDTDDHLPLVVGDELQEVVPTKGRERTLDDERAALAREDERR